MPDELAQRIFGTPSAMALSVLAVLCAFLLVAAWSDLRRQRIPNVLVLAGMLLALALHSVLPSGHGFLSVLPGGLGFLGALNGLVFGLLALLPFYLLRAMGAGDVKLLAMVGAFVGPVDIWWALLFTLVAGGALSVVLALHRGMLAGVLQNLHLMFLNLMFAAGSKEAVRPARALVTASPMPYGVAIAVGSIGWGIYRARLFGLL